MVELCLVLCLSSCRLCLNWWSLFVVIVAVVVRSVVARERGLFVEVVRRRSSFVGRRSSFVVRRSSFVVRRSSFVVRRNVATQLRRTSLGVLSPVSADTHPC